MDDYFFLGTLSKGETGKVVLNVSLDGETEGNAYFDTLARLALKFAVEPNVDPETITKNNVVTKENVVTQNKDAGGSSGDYIVNRTVSANREKLSQTGDRTTLFPLYLAIAGFGIVCLALGIRNVRNKASEEEGDE
jgi:hypothetical protein